MHAHPTPRGSRTAAVAIVTLLLGLAAWAVLAAAPASSSPAAASAAAKKKCSGGKVLVRRPGRSSVCARKCPAGKKHKVSKTGKVSCVKKRKPAAAPAPPPAGDGTQTGAGTPTAGGSEPAPESSGPAAGPYTGETEQSRPVTFTVEGNEVRNFEAGVNTWCNTMYNNRVNFDAIANVPPMAIGPDGSFSYTGDETNGNVKISGVVTGKTATGTVGMMRGDTNYSGGQMYYGSCSASDVKWSAAGS